MKTIFTVLICIVLTTAGSMFLMNRYMRVETPVPMARPTRQVAPRPAAAVVVVTAPAAPAAPAAKPVDPADRGAHLAIAYDRLAADFAGASDALQQVNGMIGRQAAQLRQWRPDGDGE